MMLIFGLMLLKTAACLEFNCSFYQEGPCYAALGHKLNLRMLDASRYNLMIQKRISSTEKDPVCRVRDDRIREKECDLFNNRSEVSVINGTLIINRVIRADSGTYRLYLEDSNGRETSTDLQVIVEGLEFNCSFYQSDPCYAALGHKLNLLMVDASRYDLKILKRINYNTQDDPVCRVKDDRIKEKECDLFNNRPVTVINGILIINRVIRADSGTYRLEVDRSDGSETSTDLQVIVEESSVSVVFVLVWCFQLMFLLGLLGGFHIYMRHTSGKKQEDQQVRMRRFREGHEHTAED